MTSQTFTGTLVAITCGQCGVTFGLDAEHQKGLRESGETFYCPNGHAMVYRESEKDREIRQLRWDRDWYARRLQETSADAERARRAAAARKGVVTRMKRRLAKGVCPCCNRYFENLHRHLQNQHPEFLVEADAGGAR